MGKCHLMWSKEPGKNKVACLWHNDSNNLKMPWDSDLKRLWKNEKFY